jgi:hypothetical protein
MTVSKSLLLLNLINAKNYAERKRLAVKVKLISQLPELVILLL